MRVLVAIDSFKGSVSSLEAGEAIKEGIEELSKSVEIIPIADGGEGSVEAMVTALGAKFVSVKTLDPLGREMVAEYAIKGELAILEMASSSGITLLTDEERNPNLTSTYGFGLMIKDAILKGARKFIVGIGGSATNDAGTGMLEALGFEFFDENGNLLKGKGESLVKIAKISSQKVIPELKECEFEVACDVNNPLFGTNGAAHIYGPQKGADEEMVKSLDAGLESFAEVTAEFSGIDNSGLSGSGAAGGLGFGFVSFLNSKLLRGFEIIAKVVGLEEAIKRADLVITGEGKLDYQSVMGKTPSEVAKLAKKHGKIVVALGGTVSGDARSLNEYVDAYFSILNEPITLKEAMSKEVTKANLTKTSEELARLVLACRKF
ncbi:MAG: glycerate kinase [Campylobacteraceae bacterium]|nr:glycerate kinase [Campylobacteraceae bacterium]